MTRIDENWRELKGIDENWRELLRIDQNWRELAIIDDKWLKLTRIDKNLRGNKWLKKIICAVEESGGKKWNMIYQKIPRGKMMQKEVTVQ